MKAQLLSAMSLMMPVIANAQETERKPTVLKDRHGVIQAIEFFEPKKVQNLAEMEFFKQYLNVGAQDTFVKANDKQLSRGYTDEHFDQFYNGVKVDGGGYNFHYNDGKMYYAHGHYVKIENLDSRPGIEPVKAKELFAAYKKIPAGEIFDFTSELLVKEIASRDDAPYLVYKIYLRSSSLVNDEIGYVNAQNGEILATEPMLMHAVSHGAVMEIETYNPPILEPMGNSMIPPATGTFATRYSGSRTASTDSQGGAFRLLDETRGAPIHTWNMQGSTVFSTRVDLTDNDNNWTSTEHSANENDMALDVHWALQQIYDRLKTAHSVNSFDNPTTGTGYPINAYIRYGSASANRDNAYWSTSDNVLLFGDGDISFRPVASVDVIAHEYGHGISDFQIGWGTAVDQSSLNEGLSDIWAAIMQNRITGGNIWQIAEQITINNPCLRDMQNTNSAGVIRPMADTFDGAQYKSSWDITLRSGVFSHWAYLLAVGESGTNDVGTYYNVYGMGMDLLENLIVRAVYGNFLDNTTSFAEVRTSMVNAARTLCGNQNGVLVQQVENAWKAVNVGTASQSVINGPYHLCPSATYTVGNLPAGSTVSWSTSDVLRVSINSSTGVATRVNGFNGDVIITATITGGCGSIVLTKQIKVGQPALFGYINVIAPDNCTGTSQLVSADVSGYSSIAWTISSGNSNNAYLGDYGNGTASFSSYYADCYGLTLNTSNSCGSSTYGTTICMDNCSYYYTVYPNPAKDNVAVQFESYSKADALPDRITLYSEKSQEAVYSLENKEIFGRVDSKGTLNIDVSRLARGTYYLHVTVGKEGEKMTERTRVLLE